MNQNFAILIRFIFAFLDLLMLNVIFLSIKWLYVPLPVLSFQGEYLYFWIVANSGWLACCGLYNLYEPKWTQKFEYFTKRTVQTYFVFLVSILFYLYFSRQNELSRVFVSAFLVFFPLSLSLNRLFYLVIWLHFRNKKSLIKRIMIIGFNEDGKRLASYFERNNSYVQIIGFCEDVENVHELSHYPILNTTGNAIRASLEQNVTEIYSTIFPEQDKRIYDLMRSADDACIRFRLVPNFQLFVKQPMHMNYVSGMPVLSPRSEPLEELTNRIKKRLFDLVFSSLVILLVLSWLVPLLAIIIWLDSRGPIFFIQKRSGMNNRPFNCVKFRSMKVNKDSDSRQATKNDHRLTRVGKFLRQSSLDELPQFFNVFKGDMSVVGPRPHMLKHTQDYSNTINKFMVRQFIKPGITGWAQVHGYRGEIHTADDIQLRVDHDLWYLENWSFFVDIKIIMLTILNTFRGEEKAY